MKPEKILVVDDEVRIVENITRCLTREGFNVTGIHNGDEAVNVFRQQGSDLILLDISMPGMNGFEAMEKILEMDSDVMVVIMTGFATVESAVKALKLGAWDYLKKPFEYAELVKTVKNGLRQRRLIKDKKRFAARLKASEKQFEYIVNHSPDLIFTLDREGCFKFINQQFETVLGRSRESLVGRPFIDIVYEDDREKTKSLVPDILSTRSSTSLNLRFKKTVNEPRAFDPYDGMVFIELEASAMGADGPTPSGIFAVARDVTGRLKLEAQLRQAQKMEAIGTLAGGIAHDFNNILMGIQGYASLVRSGFDRDSEVFKRLASIDEYVNNGADMARQLLGFAQKNNPETHRLNLNYLLKMSAKMFGRTKKDIIIRHDLEKRLWSTVVDEGQIKQVLMNLYVNAWQAMPGGGTIQIRSRNVAIGPGRQVSLGLAAPGNYVAVCVTDTGAGMDKETMARIFDPFFTTKRRGQGTGLGLATAYGIIKSHNGVFKVDSVPGKGSAFSFYLPASETATGGQAPRTGDVTRHLIEGRETVLVVDDEEGVLDVCSEMLDTLGYKVLLARSGGEAIKLFEDPNHAVDLVILDMVMPGMSGEQTYEAIRSICPDTRFLICSGFSKEEEIRKMVEKGCDSYLLKPFDMAMLSEKLGAIFSNQSPKVREKV